MWVDCEQLRLAELTIMHQLFIGIALVFQISDTALQVANSHDDDDDDGTFLILSYLLDVQSGLFKESKACGEL